MGTHCSTARLSHSSFGPFGRQTRKDARRSRLSPLNCSASSASSGGVPTMATARFGGSASSTTWQEGKPVTR
jgi:hypothetical protein